MSSVASSIPPAPETITPERTAISAANGSMVRPSAKRADQSTVAGGQSCADDFEMIRFMAARAAINTLLTISRHHWHVLLDKVCTS